MTISKCPKCNNTSFEVIEKKILGSQYKLNLVQCTQCGSVVGVIEYYNIGQLVKDLERKLDSSVSEINYNLNVINQNMKQLKS